LFVAFPGSARPENNQTSTLEEMTRMRRHAFLSLMLAFAVTTPSQAQQVGSPPAEKEKGPWSGKAALGFLATSGNTESSSLNSAFTVAYTEGRWAHSLELAAVNTSTDDQTSAEAYAVGWKTEFNMTERDFLFARVSWRKDRFSGYDKQLSESVGYGRRLIDTGVHFLNAELGAGARQADLADGTAEEDFILRGGINYQWKFSEFARFTQDFTAESGPENVYSESVSAIKTRLIGALALVASYTIKNNSVVPLDREKTDSFAAISVEYAF
jgi:putative salt-induced outer membrane protein